MKIQHVVRSGIADARRLRSVFSATVLLLALVATIHSPLSQLAAVVPTVDAAPINSDFLINFASSAAVNVVVSEPLSLFNIDSFRENLRPAINNMSMPPGFSVNDMLDAVVFLEYCAIDLRTPPPTSGASSYTQTVCGRLYNGIDNNAQSANALGGTLVRFSSGFVPSVRGGSTMDDANILNFLFVLDRINGVYTDIATNARYASVASWGRRFTPQPRNIVEFVKQTAENPVVIIVVVFLLLFGLFGGCGCYAYSRYTNRKLLAERAAASRAGETQARLERVMAATAGPREADEVLAGRSSMRNRHNGAAAPKARFSTDNDAASNGNGNYDNGDDFSDLQQRVPRPGTTADTDMVMDDPTGGDGSMAMPADGSIQMAYYTGGHANGHNHGEEMTERNGQVDY